MTLRWEILHKWGAETLEEWHSHAGMQPSSERHCLHNDLHNRSRGMKRCLEVNGLDSAESVTATRLREATG